jgi:hypothetical protein
VSAGADQCFAARLVWIIGSAESDQSTVDVLLWIFKRRRCIRPVAVTTCGSRRSDLTHIPRGSSARPADLASQQRCRLLIDAIPPPAVGLAEARTPPKRLGRRQAT